MTISATIASTEMELKDILKEALAKKGLSVRDLAAEVGTTYEYTRMVVNGSRFARGSTLRSICKVLDLDVEEVERVVKMQRMKANTGEILSLFPKDLQTIINCWSKLTPEQREYVSATVAEWCK